MANSCVMLAFSCLAHVALFETANILHVCAHIKFPLQAFVVRSIDVSTMAKAFGCKPGDADWNPKADIDRSSWLLRLCLRERKRVVGFIRKS